MYYEPGRASAVVVRAGLYMPDSLASSHAVRRRTIASMHNTLAARAAAIHSIARTIHYKAIS